MAKRIINIKSLIVNSGLFLDTKENLINENKGFKAQKPKINHINSLVGTKTSMNGDEKEEK